VFVKKRKEIVVMEEIEVRIGGGGNIRIETTGFKGSKCFDADQFLREGLGEDAIEEEKKTSEYYEHEVAGEIEVVKER